jgi:glucose uptake protein GlcU
MTEISGSNLLAGFIFGVLGFYFLKEAKKRSNLPWFLIGITLIVYPYFVTNAFLNWALGLVLVFIAYNLRS